MATIAENIKTMAELVAEVKKTYRLTETTVMRIVDMNFAIAQSANQQTFGGGEEVFPEGGFPPEPEGEPTIEDGDEDVLAAVVEKES